MRSSARSGERPGRPSPLR
ncbi:phage DNA packaging protein J [Leucobacter tenebrionis]|nr:phage DNA packaging protein J [Leucobacter tenebrionis]